MRKYLLGIVALGLLAALIFPAPRRAMAEALTFAMEKIGNAIPTHALMMGGSDGTNLQALKVDTSGRTIVTGPAADGAAAVGSPLLQGYGFNGVVYTPRYCDKSIAFTTLGTTARVQQIAAVANQHIYICGWQLFGSTATTGVDLTWTEGTGSNCVTGVATIGGKFLTTPTSAPTTANSVWGPSNPALRMTITAGDALCITQSSATNSTLLAGTIFYTQTP